MRGGTVTSVRLGYRVLRLPAELVHRNVEEAVSLIMVALAVATRRGSNSALE